MDGTNFPGVICTPVYAITDIAKIHGIFNRIECMQKSGDVVRLSVILGISTAEFANIGWLIKLKNIFFL